MGASEFFLRYIAWRSTTNADWRGRHVPIITGIRLEIGEGLMKRLKSFFEDYEFDTKKTYAEINGAIIEAYPANHTDAVRSLPDVVFILVDEGDFFRKSEQDLVLDAVERYIGKSNTQIVFVSTPDKPGGLFDRIERDIRSIYHKVFLHYSIGLGKIYSVQDILKAKRSKSFDREYGLKYGSGLGNMFPNEWVNSAILDYDLTFHDGTRIRAIDPAYGSSMFAIVEAELRDDIIYIIHIEQHERASPSAMYEKVLIRDRLNPCDITLVDSAHPGLIGDLQRNDIDTIGVNFRAELSEMSVVAPSKFREKKIKIHPSFEEGIAQLKAITTDAKGHPDKKNNTFDIGDCILMICKYFDFGEGNVISTKEEKIEDEKKETNEIIREEEDLDLDDGDEGEANAVIA